jgi:hypothetical protein
MNYRKENCNNNPDVARIVTLSTRYIRPETAEFLENEKLRETNGLSVAIYKKGEYGWFIYVPDPSDFDEEIPTDLRDCMYYAYNLGCTWLCLERDGDEVDGLPDYISLYDRVETETVSCTTEPKFDHEKIQVETPAGKIVAKISPDTEYPGICLYVDEFGSGEPGAIMEYDPNCNQIKMRVYSMDDPGGDPVCIYPMTAESNDRQKEVPEEKTFHVTIKETLERTQIVKASDLGIENPTEEDVEEFVNEQWESSKISLDSDDRIDIEFSAKEVTKK